MGEQLYGEIVFPRSIRSQRRHCLTRSHEHQGFEIVSVTVHCVSPQCFVGDQLFAKIQRP